MQPRTSHPPVHCPAIYIFRFFFSPCNSFRRVSGWGLIPSHTQPTPHRPLSITRAQSLIFFSLPPGFLLQLGTELEIGQLHHNSTFTLQGSIAALELMDPKMDSGMKTESMLAPIKTLDDAVNRGLALETLKPAELLGIMDDLVGALVSWLKGHSLVQTVFSCVYLHDVERIHDLSLKAFCVGLLKIVS